MSRDAKISEPPPLARPLGLSPEERQYLGALVADLRAGPVEGDLNRTDDRGAPGPSAPKQPRRPKYQIIVDALAIAVGLAASGAIVWMINSTQG